MLLNLSKAYSHLQKSCLHITVFALSEDDVDIFVNTCTRSNALKLISYPKGEQKALNLEEI